MIATEALAQVFVEVADTLVREFDIVDFLEMVTTRTADLSGADAAGLLLEDPQGELRFMAASAESLSLLEVFQLQSEEGPCLDCFRFGTPVTNANLRTAGSRWPTFAPAAVAAGYTAVHAFPLRHQQRVIGALNLFSADSGRLDDGEVTVVQALADVATIGLLQERAIRDGVMLTQQLQNALTSRVVIEQAKGILARTHDVDIDTAFALLRSYARRGGLQLGAVARDVVNAPHLHPGLIDRG